MTDMVLNRERLAKLNSMTQYPSIETYHGLDPKTGMLLEDEVTKFTGTVVVTEKIDGCNARIILLPNGTYILGSRTELLYAQGDLIENPAHGIVDTLKNIAERLAGTTQDGVVVAFGEVYGIGNGPWGNYTSRKEVGGFRLFDVMTVENWPEIMGWTRENIAGWRDRGGQQFRAEPALNRFAQQTGVELTPRLMVEHCEVLPVALQETLDWMVKVLPSSQAKLSPGGAGVAEGVVIRSWARSIIAKARFKDYSNTLRRMSHDASSKAAFKAELKAAMSKQ